MIYNCANSYSIGCSELARFILISTSYRTCVTELDCIVDPDSIYILCVATANPRSNCQSPIKFCKMVLDAPLSGVQRGMLWFRKGLRLHDNPALLAACKTAYMAPVFVLDPWFLVPQRVGVNRLNFLLESLAGMDLPSVQGLAIHFSANRKLQKTCRTMHWQEIYFQWNIHCSGRHVNPLRKLI
jgi:DNA photolyase